MSRSFRKTPIFGHTTCHSERPDKKRWHKALRAKERAAQSALSADNMETHTTIHENQVGNIWSMGKDGHFYWSKASRNDTAQTIANNQGKTPEERAALKKRLLSKWIGK